MSARHVIIAISATLLGCLVFPLRVRAQLVVDATLESQYWFQGFALSNGEPDARLGVSYDTASGAYGGVSTMLGKAAGYGIRPLGYLGYLGFARKTSQGFTWDVGLSNSDLSFYLPADASGYAGAKTAYAQRHTLRYDFDYTELYGGVSGQHFATRLYLSPDYLGAGGKTAYLDLSATMRPASRLRLYMHAGALTPLGGGSAMTLTRERFDFGPGVAFEFRHGEIGLSWTTTTSRVEYPPQNLQDRNALVLRVSGYF